MIISGASPVFGFSYDFVNTVTGFVGFVPVPVIFALSFAVVLWFFTAKTRLGRNIYAVGGNKESAFYSGIDVKLHTLIVFMISGLCAGLAGVLSIARLGAAEPAAGTGFETYAIAAVIIGGTSFFGGKGAHPLGGDRRPDHRHHQQRTQYPARPHLLSAGGDGRPDHLGRGSRPPDRPHALT